MALQNFLQPINFSFLHNNEHILIYFKNHREYCSFEARIKEDDTGKVYIWAILARKDKTQIDFVNDEQLAKTLYEDSPKREIYYREIKYFQNTKVKKPHVALWFTTHKNEAVEIAVYCATVPSDQYGGMVELPEDFVPEVDLPVMLRKNSSFLSFRSSVNISGRKYPIPHHYRFPFLLRTMKGYYTKNYNLLLFKAIEESLEIIATPTAIELGQSWIYQGAKRVYKYTITSITEHGFLVKLDNHLITVIDHKGYYAISKIYAESFGGYNMTICFSTPIPLNAEDEVYTQCEFHIEIDGRKRLVSGKAYTSVCGDSTNISLVADTPSWLHSYSITSLFVLRDKEIISSTVLA